ncbi:MAG TPA: class I SAM-dependent methyltransferase [Thermomicrobiales bacterium]|nr:class I SAM-dependent methyltransferase [Thermomicrobiales bacterium]
MTTPAWFPDELIFAGPEHLDADYVAGYERKTGVTPDADVAVLQGLGLGLDDTVVDLGAGTGAFAFAIAPFCRRVVAVDVSEAMLEPLRVRIERDGVVNVEPVHGGFLSYEHRGDPAAFVYSRNALHHLPDFWKGVVLSRIASMLRPGGILRLVDLVYDFGPGEAAKWIEPWLAGASPTSDVGWTREEYETHLRDEYSTFTWLLEPMIERAGLRIADRWVSDNRIYAAYTCERPT